MFISFRICPISRFEMPKSSAILKHIAQGIFPSFDFSKMVFSIFSRSIINSDHPFPSSLERESWDEGLGSSRYGIAPITFIFVKVVKINYRELLKNYFSLPDYTDFRRGLLRFLDFFQKSLIMSVRTD